MPDHDNCPCQFPRQLSLICAMHLADHVLAGDFSNWAEIMRHAACLMGSVANQFENPPMFSSGPNAVNPFKDELEAAEFIKANATAPEDSENQFGAIDPVMLWAAIKMVLKMVLERLLS